jgi:tetratricopeptide (TPR) repeat protein
VVFGLVAIILAAVVVAGLWASGIIPVKIPGVSPPFARQTSSAGGPTTPDEPATPGPVEPDKPSPAGAVPADTLAANPTEVTPDKPGANGNEENGGVEPQTESPDPEPEAAPEDEPRKKGDKKHKKVTRPTKPTKPAKAAKVPKTGATKDSADGHYKAANDLMRQNKVPGAIDELKKAVAIDSRHAKSYRLLGMAYYKLGKTSSAVEAFEKFIKLDPGHKDVPAVKELIAKSKGK